MTRVLFGLTAVFSLILAHEAAAVQTNSGEQRNARPVASRPAADKKDQIIVWGRALEQIGSAKAASQGLVGYSDFETRPLGRVGELLEVIPGMIATQHSGEGKANQYFLRGFNLDHGTDFSASVDGVPANMRTHGHGQGYLDLNFIIPEIVQRVEYRKGPYYSDAGDFSAAGTASFKTYDQLDRNFAEVSAGENNYLRGVAGASFDAGWADILVAGEGEIYDGPWVLDEDLDKINALVKFTRDTQDADYGLRFTAYDSSWNSTDQVPLRAIQSGRIDRLGFIDPDLGGETTRFSIAGDAAFNHAGGQTKLTAYAISYDFRLFSNFTYFLNDPINGDEFEQRDKRYVYGGDIVHQRPVTLAGRDARLKFGAEARYDDIKDVGLFNTAARQRLSTVRRDAVEELSLAAYAEAEVDITERLRGTLGLRGDYYDADVESKTLAANSGSADDSILSPSASLAWRALDSLEFYANYGQGFHSNDARGATIAIDPVSGDPVDTVDLLVRAEGAELGARFERGRFNATLSGFWLDLDSELVFVGDAGTTEPNDATRRYGIEASAFWQAADWLVLDASGAYTDAEYSDLPASEKEIPGAVETVLSAGAVAIYNDFTASLRLRHFGEAPLNGDGSAKSDPTTVVNLGLTYDLGRVRLGVDVLNLLDSKDADITYFYESQLANEAAPVEDFHLHPVEPRQIRVSLRTSF